MGRSTYAPREAVTWHRIPDLGKHPHVLSEAWEQGACKVGQWVHISINQSEWLNGPRGLPMV